MAITNPMSKNSAYCLDHAFRIGSSRALPLVRLRRPQQTFEKYPPEPLCWILFGAGTSCKTDSNHVERYRKCSRVSVRVALAAPISKPRVVNDHNTHWNHSSCVEALFPAMIFDTNF